MSQSSSSESSPNIGSKDYWLQRVAALRPTSSFGSGTGPTVAGMMSKMEQEKTSETLPGAARIDTDTPGAEGQPNDEPTELIGKIEAGETKPRSGVVIEALGTGHPPNGTLTEEMVLELPQRDACEPCADTTHAVGLAGQNKSTLQKGGECPPDIGSKEYWLQRAAALTPSARRSTRQLSEESDELSKRRLSSGKLPADGPVWSELRAKIERRGSQQPLNEVSSPSSFASAISPTSPK